MGSISRYTFTDHALTTTSYKSWLDSLDCPLITTNIDGDYLYVNVDDAYVLYFNPWGTYRMGYQLRGESHDLAMLNPNHSQTIVVCFSDDVFYIQHNGNYGAGRRMLSIYEKLDERRYTANVGAGTDSSSTHAWYSIQDVNFLCLEDNLLYKHDSRLKYEQKIDYIDYTVDNLLTAGGEITNTVDPNFVSCSTVIANSILTFNDQNFYAVGSNILFPTD